MNLSNANEKEQTLAAIKEKIDAALANAGMAALFILVKPELQLVTSNVDEMVPDVSAGTISVTTGQYLAIEGGCLVPCPADEIPASKKIADYEGDHTKFRQEAAFSLAIIDGLRSALEIWERRLDHLEKRIPFSLTTRDNDPVLDFFESLINRPKNK